MRRNQAIIDEAARSVRRTFIGSVAGSVTMLGVVGAAGAYGASDKLNAQSLSEALVSLHVKFSPAFDRAGRAAVAVAATDSDEVVLPVPPRKETPAGAVAEIVSTRSDAAPEKPVETVAAPAAAVSAPPAVAAPAATQALPPPAAAPRRMPFAMPQAAAEAPAMSTLAAPAEPAVAAVTAATPEPNAANRTETPTVPAALVFEPPQLDRIRPMTELPKTVIVTDAPKAVPVPAQAAKPETVRPETVRSETVGPEAVKPKKTSEVAEPAAPVTTGSAAPVVEEFPRLVQVPLPPFKPKPTPAQLLDLTGKDYDKAEHCLAQAVYFEARNEPVRGQQAVAQVVLNRVFSPYYPKDICSVVYQNAHRHLSCQFTFACDGKPEAIRERGAWARANRIAKQSLEAKVWLPEVAKATHYHATYVRPAWIRDMKVMVKHGVHIFYRPRNWGDGKNEPGWGPPAATPAATTVRVAHNKGARS